MELAGLACAHTLATVYDRSRYPRNRIQECSSAAVPGTKVVHPAFIDFNYVSFNGIIGGDGLVAARHLGMFGYKPTIYMPKDIYKRLKTQCDNMEIETLRPSSGTESLKQALGSSDVVLDAVFGVSFKGPVRAPFDEALLLLTGSQLPIVSVDIPSGWDVEAGKAEPSVLVSLIAPKEGVRGFGGRHFLGGRFVPKTLARRFNLDIPEYPGHDQIVELPPLEDSRRL